MEIFYFDNHGSVNHISAIMEIMLDRWYYLVLIALQLRRTISSEAASKVAAEVAINN